MVTSGISITCNRISTVLSAPEDAVSTTDCVSAPVKETPFHEKGSKLLQTVLSRVVATLKNTVKSRVMILSQPAIFIVVS